MWYAETKSSSSLQRNYWQVYGSNEPDKETNKAWSDKFLATGSVHNQSAGAQENVSDKKVKQICHGFQRSLINLSSVQGTAGITYDVAQRSAQTAVPVCIERADCPGAEAGQ
jgi:hypothetical protein